RRKYLFAHPHLLPILPPHSSQLHIDTVIISKRLYNSSSRNCDRLISRSVHSPTPTAKILHHRNEWYLKLFGQGGLLGFILVCFTKPAAAETGIGASRPSTPQARTRAGAEANISGSPASQKIQPWLPARRSHCFLCSDSRCKLFAQIVQRNITLFYSCCLKPLPNLHGARELLVI
ncbi:hypothetical protein JZ751_020296, partial [Albula glossodonta]